MYRVLTYISFISILIPLISGILKFTNLNRMLRLVFAYIIIGVITEIFSYILAGEYLEYYHVLQNTFVVLEYLLFAYIYFIEFNNKYLRGILIFLSLIFISVSIKIFLFSENNQPANFPSVIEAWILISFSTYFFYKIQSEMKITRLKGYPFFWFNCAILLYFASSFIVFLFDDYLRNCKKEEFQEIWSLHLVGNILFNSLLAIGIWKAKHK